MSAPGVSAYFTMDIANPFATDRTMATYSMISEISNAKNTAGGWWQETSASYDGFTLTFSGNCVGVYYVYFKSERYLAEYYDNVATFQDAKPIEVKSNDTISIKASLKLHTHL